MSLATQVLVGLVLGIALGILIGEKAEFLGIAGRAFILLLQVTVLPFMVASLVLGLGRLDLHTAISVARSGGIVLLVLWAIVIAVVLAFPFTFPSWKSASFFSSALVAPAAPVDFLSLYIPANPFHALANAVVPAIAVFSIALGVALIGVPGKAGILDVLATLQVALERITGAVVRLAPLGVFALMASAAGTLEIADLGRIQVYVLTYSFVAVALSLWVLPALVMMVTPLRYREVIGPVRDALMTAFATGNLLIILPIIAQEGKQILRRAGLDEQTTDASIDVLVPASFTLPNMGKLLSLAFVPFAGWFTGFEMSAAQYPMFAVAGFVSFFGEPIVSLPFLLNMLHIPADAFDLFVTIDVIASRFGTLLAAMHTLVLGVLGAFVMSGRVRVTLRRILPPAAGSVALLIAVLVGTRLFFTYAVEPEYTKARELLALKARFLSEDEVRETPAPPRPGAAQRPGTRLAQVQERASLRACYWDFIPYSFRNVEGHVVGHDIELVHLLARELNVRLELVQSTAEEVARMLQTGVCDVAATAMAITPDKNSELRFSAPMGTMTLAFLVRDHDRAAYSEWGAIEERAGLAVALSGPQYYRRLLTALLPKAQIITVESPRVFFEDTAGNFNAFAYGAEPGSAWTIIHPEYSVAVPGPERIGVPVGYALPRDEPALAEYVDAFIRLKREDGTLSALFAYWIEGKSPGAHKKRWSVARDVLGWID